MGNGRFTAGATSSILQDDGVIIHKVGETRAITSLWTVVVLLDIPIVPNLHHLEQQLQEHLRAAEPLFGEFDRAVWSLRQSEIHEQIASCNDVLFKNFFRTYDATISRIRRKRGALNFLGSIARAVMGTALDSDVQRLSGLVSAM